MPAFPVLLVCRNRPGYKALSEVVGGFVCPRNDTHFQLWLQHSTGNPAGHFLLTLHTLIHTYTHLYTHTHTHTRMRLPLKKVKKIYIYIYIHTMHTGAHAVYSLLAYSSR